MPQTVSDQDHSPVSAQLAALMEIPPHKNTI